MRTKRIINLLPAPILRKITPGKRVEAMVCRSPRVRSLSWAGRSNCWRWSIQTYALTWTSSEANMVWHFCLKFDWNEWKAAQRKFVTSCCHCLFPIDKGWMKIELDRYWENWTCYFFACSGSTLSRTIISLFRSLFETKHW